jgi:hypothetical protein
MSYSRGVAGAGWRERRVDAVEFEVSGHLVQQAQQFCPVVPRQLAEQGDGGRPCAVFRRFAQFSSVGRSAWDNTSGSNLAPAMPPADRGPKGHVTTQQESGTKRDSRGD